jgi:hypothetical protein
MNKNPYLNEELIEKAYQIIETKLVPNKNLNSHLYFKNKKTIKFIMVSFDGFDKNKKYRLKRLEDHVFKKSLDGEFVLNGAVATYIGKINKIYVDKSKISLEVLVHELLHMATYESEENPGFICRIDTQFFEHLNEGIVQYLARKLVNSKETSNCIYSSQARIAKLLEYIVGEDDLLYYFSNLKFAQLNKDYPLKNEKYAILKLTCLTENFHDLMEDKENYETTKKEAKKIEYKMSKMLNVIQKILIELYTDHRLKYASKEEIEKFLNSLITVDVDNEMIKELLKPVLPKKEQVHSKMNTKMKKYIRE